MGDQSNFLPEPKEQDWHAQRHDEDQPMTTPPDFFAKNANKSATPPDAQVGLPSEALREIVKASLPSIAIAIEEWLFNSAADDKAASDIADLIRPAFEAKEREIEAAISVAEMNATAGAFWAERGKNAEARALSAEAKLADCAMYLKDGETPRQRMDRDHADALGLIKLLEQEKRRTEAAEAKLAQAVEALEPFDDALGEDDDGYPDDTKLTVNWRAHTDYSLTLADLRRARSAAARGEKT